MPYQITKFSVTPIATTTTSLHAEPDIPELQTWIAKLCLSEADKKIPLAGGWLDANFITAGTKLLKLAFPNLKDTFTLSYKNQ